MSNNSNTYLYSNGVFRDLTYSALMLISVPFIGSPSILPTENHVIDIRPNDNIKKLQGEIVMQSYTSVEHEQFQVLQDFASNLLAQMQPLDPEIATALNEDFWDLI